MFLIWFVSGMIRLPLAMAVLVLLIPVAVLFVIVTSPVRMFNKSAHEDLCDKFLKSSHRLLTLVADGKASDF
jgi:Zn-dependent membrane protease YugP